MTRSKRPEERVRLNLEIPVSIKTKVERLMVLTGADSLTEAIRHAINLHLWIEE